jgi:hypothetical protein
LGTREEKSIASPTLRSSHRRQTKERWETREAREAQQALEALEVRETQAAKVAKASSAVGCGDGAQSLNP